MDPITQSRSQSDIAFAASRYMSKVYFWMGFGLLITAIIGYVVGTDIEKVRAVQSSMGFIIILQFGLVLGLSFGINKMSVGAATLCFLLYSFVTGIFLSSIFLVYSMSSIGTVFAVTAGMFGGMALFGLVTKRDLSGMGTFMMMGLWGVIIAMVVNFFLKSPALDFAMSLAGVIIFAGLAAYDNQRIKAMAFGFSSGRGGFMGAGSSTAVGRSQDDVADKAAIIGALTLYLDFLNLFLFLLRLMGGRRRD